MSKTSKDRMQLTVELMRRGAIMLKEPCQVCNGVQIRYHDKTYCTNHDDLGSVLSVVEISYSDTMANLKELFLIKVREVMTILEGEKSAEKQDVLVSLLLKYVELLRKVSE